MATDFDVLVVGGRCAGATLATALARRGLRTGVVERASFPSDTHSTHVFQVEGINVLRRLGVLDEILAESGAPLIRRVAFQLDDEVYDRLEADVRPGDDGLILNVRRTILDDVLQRAAKAAGAEVMCDTVVRDLTWSDGRVSGVRVEGTGGERTITARLVVGADGTASTVGRLVGARRYHVRELGRIGVWAYYEDPDPGEPTSFLGIRDGDLALRSPGDSGLHLVIAIPERERMAEFRADPRSAVESYLRPFHGFGPIFDRSRLHGDVRMHRLPTTFMRESAGPGWVLVGDAGHFKDPTAGQGISDAFRQTEHLADAILTGFGGVVALDTAMERWWRWRDDDAFDKHHWAADLGQAGPMPALVRALFGDLLSTPEGQRMATGMIFHRVRPSEALTPVRAVRCAVRMLVRGDVPRGQVVGELRELVANDAARRRERTSPVYADPDARAVPPADRAPLRADDVQVAGVRIPLLEGGGDSDDAVVFVHGNPGSGRDFADVAERVATFARVLAPDLPGFGRADKPDDFDHRVDHYADVLGGVLDARGVRRVHLVVHDFGGPWGLEWASRHPERLASVCLVNTGVMLDYRWHLLARLWQTKGLGEAFMATASRPAFGALSNLRMTRPLPDETLDRMWTDFDASTRRAVLRLYRNTPQLDLQRYANRWSRALRPLDVPALVIWGAEDPYVPEEHAHRQRAVFPAAEVAVFDRSGHFPFVDDPERFAATLVPFLRRQIRAA